MTQTESLSYYDDEEAYDDEDIGPWVYPLIVMVAVAGMVGWFWDRLVSTKNRARNW